MSQQILSVEGEGRERLVGNLASPMAVNYMYVCTSIETALTEEVVLHVGHVATRIIELIDLGEEKFPNLWAVHPQLSCMGGRAGRQIASTYTNFYGMLYFITTPTWHLRQWSPR